MQGQRQHESPAREYLEQVKCCNDTECTHRMMKRAFLALKGGDWEEYESTFRTKLKATERAFDRIEEAFEKVAKDEARKLSTVQEIMYKKYRLPAAHHRASWRTRRSHNVPLVPRIVTVSRWKTTFGGSQGEKAYNLVVCDLWRKI